jgi:hypothetical protein
MNKKKLNRISTHFQKKKKYGCTSFFFLSFRIFARWSICFLLFESVGTDVLFDVFLLRRFVRTNETSTHPPFLLAYSVPHFSGIRKRRFLPTVVGYTNNMIETPIIDAK